MTQALRVDKFSWADGDVVEEPTVVEPDEVVTPEDEPRLLAADTLRSPAMMAAIGVAPRFAEMSASLDRGRDQIVAVVGDLQAKQARRLTKIGVKLIKAGDAGRLAKLLTGEAASADLADRPSRLVPYDEEAAAFAAAMEDLYEHGLDEYADEIRQQGVEPTLPEAADRDEDDEYLLAAALVAGALLADRMANAWAAEVTRQMRVGLDEKALAASVLNLSARLLEDLASQRVNLALSLGRALAARVNAGRVGTELYTAVMDRYTCRGGELRCWEQDGTEYPVGEGVPCPNPHCLGADRCRCVRVPVVAGAGR